MGAGIAKGVVIVRYALFACFIYAVWRLDGASGDFIDFKRHFRCVLHNYTREILLLH